MLGVRPFLGVFLCPTHCLWSRELPLACFPIYNGVGDVFPYKLEQVMGPFKPLAVITLGSVEEVSAC